MSRLVGALITFKPLYSVLKLASREVIIRDVDYLNPFHAYDKGNLSWLAAAEAKPATMSIAKRAIPEATSIEEANQIVRGNWLNVIEEHHPKYLGSSQVNDILDIGCSVGVSTRYLVEKFPSAQAVFVVGASPTTFKTGLSKHALRIVLWLSFSTNLFLLYDQHVVFEEQFGSGRLLAYISARPGQCGRADGYILEGKELEFYMKKLQRK
ncbi:40S ribosomal protein S8 [Zea mays]|uniref:40S ribosomal protein S8 n=1 Tax=Zea mays TaxID=4577 RepID=A0A3L6E8Z5_MAIZE|nr:40S ribosomal protein S8 [Zea mays]